LTVWNVYRAPASHRVSHGLGVKIKADEQKRGFTILLIFKMILLLSRSCIILSMATDRSPFFYSTTISTTNISFLFYYNKNPQSRNCHAEEPDNGHTRNFFIMKFYILSEFRHLTLCRQKKKIQIGSQLARH
jgi:hypothetical protein